MKATNPCPCDANKDYNSCCGVYHDSKMSAPTALDLMRSRYSAFAHCKIDYLRETLWPPYQKSFDAFAHELRSRGSTWLGLKIIETRDGAETDTRGMVHFIASSLINEKLDQLEERSLFRKKNGQWYYVKAE